jgi:hypothetical protein
MTEHAQAQTSTTGSNSGPVHNQPAAIQAHYVNRTAVSNNQNSLVQCTCITDVSSYKYLLLTESIKHEHKIHNMDHKHTLMEICDKYQFLNTNCKNTN